MQVTPTGMVPNEDTGTIMGAVTLPPGTSQERTYEVMNKVDSLIAADPAVESRTAVVGFSFIGGQGPSYGSFIIKLKDWEDRSMMQNSDIVYGSLFMRAQKIVKDAQVLFFTPPMIPGYSASSDINLRLTRTSRNMRLISMLPLVRKPVSVQRISCLPCRDIMVVCMPLTSTVSVRCTV
jgi:HAE1 family hydrophobic/amphiphilic exporter-1